MMASGKEKRKNKNDGCGQAQVLNRIIASCLVVRSSEVV